MVNCYAVAIAGFMVQFVLDTIKEEVDDCVSSFILFYPKEESHQAHGSGWLSCHITLPGQALPCEFLSSCRGALLWQLCHTKLILLLFQKKISVRTPVH